MKVKGIWTGAFVLLMTVSCSSATSHNSSDFRKPAQAVAPQAQEIDAAEVRSLVAAGMPFGLTCTTGKSRNSDVVAEFSSNQSPTKVYKGKFLSFLDAVENIGGKVIPVSDGSYKSTYGGLYYISNSKNKIRIFDIRSSLYNYCLGNNKNDEVSGTTTDFITSVRALVGPYVTLENVSDGYMDGAAHPWASRQFVTLDANTRIKNNKPNGTISAGAANLMKLVSTDSLLQSLKDDKFLQKRLGRSLISLKSLADVHKLMVTKLVGCDIYVPESLDELMSQFSIFDYSEGTGKVAVRLGFSYGCEAMRGNYTQLGLTLNPTPEFKGYLDQEINNAKTEKRNPYFMKYQPTRPIF